MNNFQHPPRYTVEHNGKFVTVRTNRGPVGAWRGVMREDAKVTFTYIDDYITIVNGDTVTMLK